MTRFFKFLKLFENFTEERYFDDINDLETLKKRYRELANKHHPDRGGDTAVFQKINNQNEEAVKRIKERSTSGSTNQERSNSGSANQESTSGSSNQERSNSGSANQERSNSGANQERTQDKRTQSDYNYQNKKGRNKKPKLTPEQIKKIKQDAVNNYRQTLSKAKASKEKKDIRAKEKFDTDSKENPSSYNTNRFIYKRVLRNNEEEYDRILGKANSEYKNATRNL